MTELRLEFHLPQFLLPEDWAPEGEEEEGNPTDKLGAPSVSQGSLLGEDTLSSFSMDPCSSMDVSSEAFPCLADELEQQAKALEREWYCPEEPLVVAPTRPLSASLLGLSSAVPALKHSSLHLRQQQLSELAVVKEEEMVCQDPEDGCGSEECEEEEESIPPSTPTKRSQGHNSSWNESQCVVALAADPHEVQSPARPPALLAPLPHLPAPRLASLSLAVNNAQSIRLRGQPLDPAAWRGCTKNPWCNREVRHRGPCNHRAAVPGLLAYSQSQLFECGVNVDELCRAPELAAGSGAAPMFSNSAQSGPTTSAGVEGSPLLTKRKADFESDVCGEVFSFPCPFPFLSAPAHLACEQQQEEQQQRAANQRASGSCPPSEPAGPDTMSGHSQQGSRAAERSSSECGQPQEQLEHSAERPKRQRVTGGMACEAAERAGSEAAQQGSSGFIRPLEAGDAAELQRQASVDNSLSAEATLPLPAAEPVAAEAAGPTSAAAAAPAAALAAPAARTGLRSKAGGRFGSRARRASPTTTGAPTAAGQQGAAPVAQLQSPTPASRGASKSSTPSKQASRQLPKTPDAANPGVRTNQRRVILQWNADQVTDPRSGKVVCHVEPATFCTQCFVTHTPVWRAGPFGVKTLCNACGVRYMKYVGKNKK